MELSNTYRRLLQVPQDHVVLLPPGELIDVTGINAGILFIVAKWSMASQIAFRNLNIAPGDLPEMHDLMLYIADTDDEQAENFITQNDGVPSGGGETYWIKHGRIVAKLANYTEIEQPTIRENTALATRFTRP